MSEFQTNTVREFGYWKEIAVLSIIVNLLAAIYFLTL
jgi:hypothetical protein